VPTRRQGVTWLATWGPAIAGALALAAVGRGPAFPASTTLLLVVALSATAEHIHIPLPSGGYQTFGATISLPAIALFGPVPAAWAAAVGVMVGDGILRRRRISTMMFNVGQRILAILLAGLVWNMLLRGSPTFGRVDLVGTDQSILAAVLALLGVYATATTVQVAAFLSAFRQERFWKVLAASAMWRLPTGIILGAFGLSASVLVSGIQVQSGNELGQVLTALLAVSLIALLYTSRRQQLSDLANLHSAVADLLQTLDLREVLKVLADKIERLANPDMLWITLRGGEGEYEVALARTPGVDPARLKPPSQRGREHGVMGWVVANRRSQRIGDYLRDPRRTQESSEIFDPKRVRAVLMVPMLAGTEPVGVITLTKPIPSYFSEYHERVVRTLATQAAVVVRNAQLYETTQRDVARFEALKAISDRINSQLDLQAVFDLIAESAREVLGADRCGLYLGAGTEITHTMAKGLPADYLRSVSEGVQEEVGLGSLTMRLNEPIIVTDALADSRAKRMWAEKLGYRTIATFPLSYRDTMIGLLALYHDTVHPYAASDVTLGVAFAGQAAIAVQNTRLRQEAEGKAHHLALLNRAFTRLATSLRTSDLFDALVEELHTTLDYPLVMLRLVEGDQLRHVAHRGYAGVKETSPLTAGIVGRVARTGQPAFVTDVSLDPDYIAWEPRVTQEACVPILNQGSVVGVINVELFEPRLAQADFDLLTTLAGYAAVALEKAQLYEQTQALATTDGLTSLLNYRAFWQALDRELERSMRYGLPLSLIMIEIDKFKRYNDTYGHLRGDEVIRLVARVLRQEHRAQIDLVARYGGDEFMILLPHTQKVTAAEIAERIRRAVESTPLISEAEVASVTLSLGVASYPEDGKSTDTLVDAADQSMYRAKQRGGNAVALANLS
jgi:diguanylate cyclase (GGDEF)-like protein